MYKEFKMSDFTTNMNQSQLNVVMFKAFQNLDWNNKNDPELVGLMQQAINEDPIITDPSLISVTLEKEKGGRLFTLLGKVKNKDEMKRAEQIVTANAQKNASVKNKLIVDNA
jgi:hypothetical protein